MTTITIKSIEEGLAPTVREYAENKLARLEKFMSRYDSAQISCEVEKTTNHHKSGEVYRAGILISGIGSDINAVSEKEDVYMAIDDARDEAERQLVAMKDRKDTLFRRGARSVKKMLKGLSSRNPFTSKSKK